MEKSITLGGSGYLALAFAEDRRKHPEAYDTSPEALAAASRVGYEKAQAVHRLNDPQPDSPEAEYHKLRTKHYELTQAAKNAEIYLNTKSGEVKHHDSRVAELKKKAKEAADANKLREEKMWIHQAAQAERDLSDAKDAFYVAQKQNQHAVNNLKTFDQKRFDELKKQLFTVGSK